MHTFNELSGFHNFLAFRVKGCLSRYSIYDMTFEEASHEFKIPIEDLKAMRREGLLSEPLSPQEINNLSFLRYFWGKSVWLKRQLRRINRKTRLALIRTAEYSKVEAYIFSRYYNAREGERFSVKLPE